MEDFAQQFMGLHAGNMQTARQPGKNEGVAQEEARTLMLQMPDRIVNEARATSGFTSPVETELMAMIGVFEAMSDDPHAARQPRRDGDKVGRPDFKPGRHHRNRFRHEIVSGLLDAMLGP
jgi:hypothetical protein